MNMKRDKWEPHLTAFVITMLVISLSSLVGYCITHSITYPKPDNETPLQLSFVTLVLACVGAEIGKRLED